MCIRGAIERVTELKGRGDFLTNIPTFGAKKLAKIPKFGAACAKFFEILGHFARNF